MSISARIRKAATDLCTAFANGEGHARLAALRPPVPSAVRLLSTALFLESEAESKRFVESVRQKSGPPLPNEELPVAVLSVASIEAAPGDADANLNSAAFRGLSVYVSLLGISFGRRPVCSALCYPIGCRLISVVCRARNVYVSERCQRRGLLRLTRDRRQRIQTKMIRRNGCALSDRAKSVIMRWWLMTDNLV